MREAAEGEGGPGAAVRGGAEEAGLAAAGRAPGAAGAAAGAIRDGDGAPAGGAPRPAAADPVPAPGAGQLACRLGLHCWATQVTGGGEPVSHEQEVLFSK